MHKKPPRISQLWGSMTSYLWCWHNVYWDALQRSGIRSLGRRGSGPDAIIRSVQVSPCTACLSLAYRWSNEQSMVLKCLITNLMGSRRSRVGFQNCSPMNFKSTKWFCKVILVVTSRRSLRGQNHHFLSQWSHLAQEQLDWDSRRLSSPLRHVGLFSGLYEKLCPSTARRARRPSLSWYRRPFVGHFVTSYRLFVSIGNLLCIFQTLWIVKHHLVDDIWCCW